MLACGDSKSPQSTDDQTDRISAAIRFAGSDIVQGSLPDPTDERVTILPLEPTLLLTPGKATVMALEVDDPDDRNVVATLMQFEDEDNHHRTPQEGGGSAVESQIDLEDELCTGRCGPSV